MLNPDELHEYFERAKLSDVAINIIQRIRNSEPERRVESGESSVACRFASNKMKLTIQSESHTNELPSVIGWEFDENTYEFWDQPQKLKITYLSKEGKKATHFTTPDYFLLQEGFTGWVECKTEQKLQELFDSGSQLFIKDEHGNWRCPAGEAAAAEFGLKFMVRSSAENETTFVRNLVFLEDYLDARCPQVPQSDTQAILEVFQNKAWHDVKSLIDNGFDADHIYKLIADQKLYFDLRNQLLARTHLTVVYRDKVTADAYEKHVRSQNSTANKFTSELKLDVGESFIWDQVAWTIINLGAKSIHIKNSDGVVQNLNYSMFDQLATDEIITGVNNPDADADGKIEEILRHASPEALRQASKRYQQIFSQDSSLVTSPDRTIRRWKKMYRDAELVYGNGYIGLLSKAPNRGNHVSKLDQRVWEIADEVINEMYLIPNGRSKTICWGEVEVRCSEEGLIPPSEKSFLAHIKQLDSNNVKKVREGEKAAYSSSPFIWYLEQSTPRHGDRAFEIGHIDHTVIDLQLVDSKYGKNLGKVCLTVLLDAFSRMVLAWVISFDPPSYRSCMAVIQHCVKRHGRVPKYLVLDQGPDFRSIYFESLLGFLESHKKERPASKPRFGSLIERFFGVNNQTFIHNLQGHNKPLQNPRALSSSHDPRNLAIWTLPAFRDAFEIYIENAYSEMEHPALHTSPKQALAVSLMESGHRPHKRILFNDNFRIMCWPAPPKSTAKVDPSRGIKIGYVYYWTSEFRNTQFTNRQVPVRYDPFNKAYAAVWLKDRWVLCVSEYQADFEGLSERQIDEATQEIKARLKNEPKRRAINARILAAFFRDITKTEQGLISQLRHLDSQEKPELEIVKPDQTLALPDLSPSETENLWANINTHVLGEFDL